MRAEGVEALEQVQGQLAVSKKESDALKDEMERRVAEFDSKAEETEIQHTQSLKVNETLQSELAELKIDLASKATSAAHEQQNSARLHTELGQLQAAKDSEKQRAARAEVTRPARRGRETASGYL